VAQLCVSTKCFKSQLNVSSAKEVIKSPNENGTPNGRPGFPGGENYKETYKKGRSSVLAYFPDDQPPYFSRYFCQDLLCKVDDFCMFQPFSDRFQLWA